MKKAPIARTRPATAAPIPMPAISLVLSPAFEAGVFVSLVGDEVGEGEEVTLEDAGGVEVLESTEAFSVILNCSVYESRVPCDTLIQ